MVAKGNHKTIYQKRQFDKRNKKLDSNRGSQEQSFSPQLSSPVSVKTSISNVSLSYNGLNNQDSFMRQQHQHASGLVNIVPPHSSTSTKQALMAPTSNVNCISSLDIDPSLANQANQMSTSTPTFSGIQTNDLNTPVAYMQASAVSPSVNELFLHQQIMPNEMLRRNQLMMHNFENANPPLTTYMQNPNFSRMMNTSMSLDSSLHQNRGTTYMFNGITTAPSPHPPTVFCNVNNQFNNIVGGTLMSPMVVGAHPHSPFNSVSTVPEANPTLPGTFFQDNAGNIRKIVGITRNQILHYQ